MVHERFVIDTSILLHDPRVITGALFIEPKPSGEAEILIPMYALEELDLIKEEQSERGKRARDIARALDRLRRQGSLESGVRTERGRSLRVVNAEQESLPPRISLQPRLIYDWLILTCAFEQGATLLTLDANLRVRADGRGVLTADWRDEESNPNAEGVGYAHAPDDRSGSSETSSEVIGEVSGDSIRSTAAHSLTPHEGPVWGLTPLNEEQAVALAALLDPEISLVTLMGKAGTGKTLLALAAGLEQVTNQERYERVMVSRAIFPLGRDLGYLPGSMEEKMEPWLQPIYDNLDFLLGQRARRQANRERPRAEDLIDLGLIEVTPITYIRGRSIPRQFLIVDEAQNLTPHEMKTMLTRAGQDTKVVLLGDPHQVDHPYLDAERNGLTVVSRRFADQRCAAHIQLLRGERSPLAELAADLL